MIFTEKRIKKRIYIFVNDNSIIVQCPFSETFHSYFYPCSELISH